jgi:hypothetical protein
LFLWLVSSWIIVCWRRIYFRDLIFFTGILLDNFQPFTFIRLRFLNFFGVFKVGNFKFRLRLLFIDSDLFDERSFLLTCFV